MAKDNQMTTETSMNGDLRNRKANKSVNGKNRSLDSMTIEEQFNAAVNVIQNLPKNGTFQPSDQLKLRFYAFYKQATEGPNQTPKPSFYEIVNRYKHDAWSKVLN